MDKGAIEYNTHCFESVTSTLDVASDLRWHHGDIIVARHQSDGRGQRGNSWHSKVGENLTFTLVIEPRHIPVNEQFRVSMTTSLAVVGALADFGIEARIKWPNDIYVGDQKICGILIEHSFSSYLLDRSMLGVGVNVAQKGFDKSLINPTSMALQGVVGVGTDVVLKHFCTAFTTFYALETSVLLQLYMQVLYHRDGMFPYRDAGGDFVASVDSIDPLSGVITLKDSLGVLRPYYFKEVSFVK